MKINVIDFIDQKLKEGNAVIVINENDIILQSLIKDCEDLTNTDYLSFIDGVPFEFDIIPENNYYFEDNTRIYVIKGKFTVSRQINTKEDGYN